MQKRSILIRTSAVAGVTGLAVAAGAGTAAAQTEVDRPSTFTSAFTAMAVPGEVVDGDDNPAPGPEGASGTFTFMINSDEEIICYDISVQGITPPYQSPANTATHIHEAPAGESGPPRLAFADPEDDGSGTLTSEGCLQGPFETGVEGDDGADTGAALSLAEIEADPAGFFADTHTADFVPGAVRGQLTEIPVGGVETGAGGTAGVTGVSTGLMALGGTAAAAAAGAVALRRRSTTGA